MDMMGFLQPDKPEQSDPPRSECRALVRRPKPGQPPIPITPEIADRICELLAEGLPVRKIGKMDGMPSTSTIRRWIRHDQEFRQLYLLAKQDMADDWFEEIDEIAADSDDDYTLDAAAEVPVVKPNKEHIARSKLRVDTKFRLIAKLAPRKYADDKALPPPAAEEASEPARNGDDAKVIDGSAVEIQHPLYESCQAWRRAARGEEPNP